MSTEIFVACMDHNPPLPHDEASGVGEHTVKVVQKDIANRELLLSMWENDLMDWPEGGRSQTFRFMLRHRHCNLGVVDEYNKTYPADQPAVDQMPSNPDLSEVMDLLHQIDQNIKVMARGQSRRLNIDLPDRQWWKNPES